MTNEYCEKHEWPAWMGKMCPDCACFGESRNMTYVYLVYEADSHDCILRRVFGWRAGASKYAAKRATFRNWHRFVKRVRLHESSDK